MYLYQAGIDDDIPATPPHQSSVALPSCSNGPDAAAASVGSCNSGTVLTIGEKRVQLYLTRLENKLTLSQAEVESKCLGCFDDLNKPCKLTWKTPLMKSLQRGGCATPLARKLSDTSVTPVARMKSGCLKPTPNNSSTHNNTLASPVTRNASCELQNTPRRKVSDANTSALHLSPVSSASLSVRRSPRHNAKKTLGQACRQYVQQVSAVRHRHLRVCLAIISLGVEASMLELPKNIFLCAFLCPQTNIMFGFDSLNVY